MRKSATNSFTGGLNLDLNPLNTPNDILTDCLNGTLITFNGDELTLQNDAGNTKVYISYPTATLYNTNSSYSNGDIVYEEVEGDKIYHKNISGKQNNDSAAVDANQAITTDIWVLLPSNEVALSTGFVPIGVKEYAGILYIVSVKTPDNSLIEFGVAPPYDIGDIVYANITGITVYYECLISNSDAVLPLETNIWWKYIGTVEDYNNQYGEVEIGTYPSPEFGGDVSYNGFLTTYSNPANYLNILYNPTTINETVFKSGRLVTFEAATFITGDLISYYIGDVYNKRFYKVKLLHQLINGYLDLTDDIWNKYRTFKGGVLDATTFWFNDPIFEYKSNKQYKGKLSLSLEIEDLDEFSLVEYPTVTKNASEEYTISFTVLMNGTEVIENVQPEVKITYGEASEITLTGTLVGTLDEGEWVFEHNLGPVVTNTELFYEIKPIISVGGVPIAEIDLPNIYIDKYTETGTVLITTDQDKIVFDPDADRFTCDPVAGEKTFEVIYLKNNLDNDLTPALVTSNTPSVYVLDGEATPVGAVLLGHYTIAGDIITVIDTDPAVPAWVHTAFKISNKIIVASEDCSLQSLFVLMADWLTTTVYDITLTQNGEPVLPYKNAGYNQFYFWLKPKVADNDNNFTIQIASNNYETISYENIIFDYDRLIDYSFENAGYSTIFFDQYYNPLKELYYGVPTMMAIQDLDRKKIELTITMNLPFPDSSKGSLYVEQIQDDVTYKGWIVRSDEATIESSTVSLGVEIVDEKTAKILIYPDIDFNIKGFLPGHDYLSYQGNVSANTSLNLAFIGVIKYTLVQATFFGNSIQAAYFQYSPSEYYGDNIAVQVIGTGLDESIQLVWGDLYDVERYEQVLQLEESAIITAPYVNETVLSGNLYDNIPENTEDYYVTRQVDSGTLVLAKNLFYSLQ